MAGVLAVEEAEIVDGEVVDEPLDGECQLVEGEVISGVSPIGIIDRLPRDTGLSPLYASRTFLSLRRRKYARCDWRCSIGEQQRLHCMSGNCVHKAH